MGEYLPLAWHERLLQAVCAGAAVGLAAGERLQPLGDIGNCGDPGRPEKRQKVRWRTGRRGSHFGQRIAFAGLPCATFVQVS